MVYVACLALAVALAASLLRLHQQRQELRRLSRTLAEIVQVDTNAQLTSSDFDKGLLAFVAVVNEVLEQSRKNLFEKERTEEELKRAITNISHDLRTPLTSAKGYLQLIESSDLDTETKDQYLQIVQERLDALQGLMDNLFEFMHITERKEALNLQELDMCSVVRDVLSEAYPAFEKGNFEAIFELPNVPIRRITDEEALRRILQNLVKNVHVHGISKMRVTLDEEAFEIANQVEHLEELDIEQIFNRFYIFDASRSNKGTGLGLAIVKELTHMLGGEISARKEGDMLVMRLVLH